MEHIERPQKLSRGDSNTQTNEDIQYNVQSQLNKIYDKLDEIIDLLNS